MKRILFILKDKRGSAQIIEMTLVFPVVLVVLGVLIYMGSYILQAATMHNDAQQIAVRASRQAAFPGYEKLGTFSSQADFTGAQASAVNKSLVDAIMKEHDPYRYWGNNFLQASEQRALEVTLEQVLRKNAFLGGEINCKITTQNNVLNQQIVVTVTKQTSVPPFFAYIGLSKIQDIQVIATAVVGDSAEFIRNTDMVFDLAGFLWEKQFGKSNQSMGQRVTIFKQKIKDAKAALGITNGW